ncbi:hypothetical protein GOBAR_DD20393 [Gossypium barbadense]|nr:hypothetical protein GOBAR_DD20393 [Gossypium barbadense]
MVKEGPERFSKKGFLDCLIIVCYPVSTIFEFSRSEKFAWGCSEDAERITKSCNLTQAPPQRNSMSQQQHTERLPSLAETDLQMLSDMEDEDLRAAIAASLMDSSPATASGESSIPKTENKDIPEKTA